MTGDSRVEMADKGPQQDKDNVCLDTDSSSPLVRRYAAVVEDLEQQLTAAKKEPGKSLAAIACVIVMAVLTLAFALLLHSKPGGWARVGEVILWVLSAVSWLIVVLGRLCTCMNGTKSKN